MLQHPESVASHSFGVAWLSMLLAPSHLDRSKCLLIGICHDLAESVVGDIPTYAGVAKDTKHKLEANGFQYLCSLLSQDLATVIFDAWDDYENGKTAEGRFVKEMDKLECILQAQEYDASYEFPHRFDEFKGLESRISSAEGKLVLDLLQENARRAERRKAQPTLRDRSDARSDTLASYIRETLDGGMDVPAQLSLKLLEEALESYLGDRWAVVEGFSEQLLLLPKQPYYYLHISGTAQCGRWENQMEDAQDRSIVKDVHHFRQIQCGETESQTWESVKKIVQEFRESIHVA
ncbi:hypothetical protein LQW54_010660 [Pestalotiopsis sp. IQ-011]